jgi:hypothetical protein
MQRRLRAFDQRFHGLDGQEFAAQPNTTAGAGNASITFPVRWQKPEIERVVRNFRHQGLSLVHLWGSGRNVLAIGLSPHGVPGIYFTQRVPD